MANKTFRGPKKMTARFAGSCNGCPTIVAAGATIYWMPGTLLCETCGLKHYAASVGAMTSKREQLRREAAWEKMTPAEREAAAAARDEANRAEAAKLEAERAPVRESAWKAEQAARAAKVRANLEAWLADRSSKPEASHAWLEKQCRFIGLLPAEAS